MPSKNKNKGSVATIEATGTAPEAAPEAAEEPQYEPKTYGPKEGGNAICAAYDFLYWIFGARVEGFDVTPEGVVAKNFRLENNGQNPDKLIKAMNPEKDRRLDLIQTHGWIHGQEPPKLTDSSDMTTRLTQFFRAEAEDGSRSPDWVKKQIAEYKKANNLAAPRGRPRTINAQQINRLTPEVLSQIDVNELDKLEATIKAARERQAQAVSA